MPQLSLEEAFQQFLVDLREDFVGISHLIIFNSSLFCRSLIPPTNLFCRFLVVIQVFLPLIHVEQTIEFCSLLLIQGVDINRGSAVILHDFMSKWIYKVRAFTPDPALVGLVETILILVIKAKANECSDISSDVLLHAVFPSGWGWYIKLFSFARSKFGDESLKALVSLLHTQRLLYLIILVHLFALRWSSSFPRGFLRRVFYILLRWI